ncbi:Wzz/FepE/Etk N-terminal domain-containing protein [Sphingobacterium sp. IITKGP-BTPF85]|uniref:Wzz/FepE/Etk N-terminal domain-containing protein n=1 Tax=Sphingobacterium sp. IITKGP-BTPF85 TaxID=1338009 RepID=UPI00038A001E|nr:Wzz/FepE/Etk N-terminal domain-containing protein [Sphingobacterium sp. IITKGP-BTPF85]KKX46592.1 hypothetical protein L950_0231065 [Sphingobacterium sp. IITKGP-BTPF85]
MMEQQPLQQKENQEEEINLRQLFEQYAYYWKWFVLAILLSMGIAVIYLRYAQKTYNTTAKILLKDERSASAGELAGIAELTSSMGFGGSRSAFVTDQIEVLTSRRLMRKVVYKHHLNVIYSTKGKIRSQELLENDMPFLLVPQGNPDTTRLKVNIRYIVGKKLQVTDMVSGKKIIADFDKVIKIGSNQVLFTKNSGRLLKQSLDYEITVVPIDWAVNSMLNTIRILPSKEAQSYIVNFAMVSTLSKKAELILNSLIDIYNADLSNDKMRMTRATSDFINKRLMIISKDLSGADEEAADFKSANSMVDMATEASVFLQNASENDKKY